MFSTIKQTEKNVIKTLEDNQHRKNLEELVNMYRSVSSLLYSTEELKDKIYPEIKKEFDEVFEVQDKMVTRVIQVGQLISTISKESERTSTSVDIDKMISDLKIALPEMDKNIEVAYEMALKLSRIQVSPSLYVLNKEKSDPELVKLFTESSLASFIKNPSIANLNESDNDIKKLKSLYEGSFDTIIKKITPFMDKVYKVFKSTVKKNDEVFDKYVAPYIKNEIVLSEEDSGDEASPYVLQIKRNAKKAIAELDMTHPYSTELEDAFNSYSDLADIINRATTLKKELSDDIKAEMDELFKLEEREYNNVVDLGEIIVAYSTISSRAASKDALAKMFVKLLNEAIPEHATIIEDIYKANVESQKFIAKSSIKVSKNNLEESIDMLRNIYSTIQSFVMKVMNSVLPRVKKVESLHATLKKINGKLNIQEQVITEDEDNNCCYCVYQPNVAVFGVSDTEEKAYESANQWIDGSDIVTKEKLKVAKCSKEVVDYYNLNGTPEQFKVEDGILKIV